MIVRVHYFQTCRGGTVRGGQDVDMRREVGKTSYCVHVRRFCASRFSRFVDLAWVNLVEELVVSWVD